MEVLKTEDSNPGGVYKESIIVCKLSSAWI